MVRPDRDKLSGAVEVDETYIGGEQIGMRARNMPSNKAVVAIAVELADRGLGRVRLGHVPKPNSHSLVGFVRSVVASGSEVHTDGWPGYKKLHEHGYRHITTMSYRPFKFEQVAMPGAHRVASLLKRWG